MVTATSKPLTVPTKAASRNRIFGKNSSRLIAHVPLGVRLMPRIALPLATFVSDSRLFKQLTSPRQSFLFPNDTKIIKLYDEYTEVSAVCRAPALDSTWALLHIRYKLGQAPTMTTDSIRLAHDVCPDASRSTLLYVYVSLDEHMLVCTTSARCRSVAGLGTSWARRRGNSQSGEARSCEPGHTRQQAEDAKDKGKRVCAVGRGVSGNLAHEDLGVGRAIAGGVAAAEECGLRRGGEVAAVFCKVPIEGSNCICRQRSVAIAGHAVSQEAKAWGPLDGRGLVARFVGAHGLERASVDGCRVEAKTEVAGDGAYGRFEIKKHVLVAKYQDALVADCRGPVGHVSCPPADGTMLLSCTIDVPHVP